MIGKIHSIETFGAVDGPGIRTVFFLQGCPARCLYCHNPDSWPVDKGEKIEVEEVVHWALRGQPYYGSKGGVTFSGGEPLYYSEIIGAVGEQMHRRGYNTLVETCGHVPQKALEDINGHVDSIYYDFKQIDPDKHKELTGVDNTLILSNLEWLCGHYSGELSVRYPYIPGCNDDEASINGFF